MAAGGGFGGGFGTPWEVGGGGFETETIALKTIQKYSNILLKTKPGS
jgi:hypothetical protein